MKLITVIIRIIAELAADAFFLIAIDIRMDIFYLLVVHSVA